MATITAKEVQANMVVLLPQEDATEEREYRYRDPETRREFQVRKVTRTDSVVFHLSEFVPNGRLVEVNAKGNAIRGWDEPRIKELEKEHGANRLMSACQAAGIDCAAMVLCGSGFSVDSRYLASLEECATEIVKALASDTRYSAFRTLSDNERQALDASQHRASRSYWEDQQKLMEAAERENEGLFKGCYTMMGQPVSKDSQVKILAYANSPTQEAWLGVRSLVITGGTTLWQAWCAADPHAPSSGSLGFPDGNMTRVAIRHAVELNKNRIEMELAKLRQGLLRAVSPN